MNVIKNIWTAFKYWAAQNFIEVILIVIFGYVGIDIMGDFCSNCLFIENLQAVSWGIGVKTVIFIVPYIIIFGGIVSTYLFRRLKNHFKEPLLNLILSLSFLVTLGILKPQGISLIKLPLISTLVSSFVIILIISISKGKKSRAERMKH